MIVFISRIGTTIFCLFIVLTSFCQGDFNQLHRSSFNETELKCLADCFSEELKRAHGNVKTITDFGVEESEIGSAIFVAIEGNLGYTPAYHIPTKYYTELKRVSDGNNKIIFEVHATGGGTAAWTELYSVEFSNIGGCRIASVELKCPCEGIYHCVEPNTEIVEIDNDVITVKSNCFLDDDSDNFPSLVLNAKHQYIEGEFVPIIYATGGEDLVNWDEREKQISHEESPFLYGSGCTESPQSASTSSCLAPQGSANYTASQSIDFNPRTAWVEGKSDYGIGQYLECDLPHGGYNVGIFNGYQRNFVTWKNNSRVKKFKVFGDGVPLCIVVLEDKMGCQIFDIPGDEEYNKYRFEIMEVYPGDKWKDVAISEICSYGCCINLSSSVYTPSGMVIASDIQVGGLVESVNLESKELLSAEIQRMEVVNHKRLLRISTERSTIEVTTYHPLFIRNHGFTSLLNLKKNGDFGSYDAMINNIDVLVWNDQTQSTEFVPVTDIRLIQGDFKTFSISATNGHGNYIVNGFVTAVY